MKKFTHIKNGKTLMIAAKDGRKNKVIKKELEILITLANNFVEHTEGYGGSYFWSNNGNASQRRRKEEDAEYTDAFKSKKIDITIDLDFKIEVSRQNVYIFKTIVVNDYETTARVFKTIVKEAEAILAQIPAKNTKEV